MLLLPPSQKNPQELSEVEMFSGDSEVLEDPRLNPDCKLNPVAVNVVVDVDAVVVVVVVAVESVGPRRVDAEKEHGGVSAGAEP